MKQQGFSLIEMMVAMVLALIIMAGAFAGFMAMANSSRDSLRSDRLNHNLQAIMDVMVADLRRAGYWNSEAAVAPATNPFSVIDTATAGCVLYSYDRDADGQIGTNERFGFKLSNGAVWMRSSGTSVTNCNDGTWERISDEEGITITALTFTQTVKCVNGTTGAATNSGGCAALSPAPAAGDTVVESRHVQIQMQGQVAQDAASRKQLTGVARVRNVTKL